MSKSAILSVKIVSDATKAKQGFAEAEKATEQYERKTAAKMEKVRDHLGVAASAATAAATAYGAFALETIKSASEMEQSTGAVSSVFKEQAHLIEDLAAGAAQSVGLAASEYQTMASVMGSQLQNLGIAQEEVVPTTEKLISLGADLSSMFGGTTSDAVSALSSLLRGERDPIERYAVSINQAAIDAHIAAQGLGELEGAAKKEAETQATLELLFNQTGDALGNFARETDTVAGQTQIATAEWENAKAALGEQFLPIAADAAKWAADFAKQIGEHPEEFKAIGGAILFTAGTFAVLYAAASAVTVVQGATVVWTAAQWALNAALTANPIGIVVVAIGALIAALVLAYENCDWFRASVDEAWKLGEKAFTALGGEAKELGDWLYSLWEKCGTWEGAMAAAKELGIEAFQAITFQARALYEIIGMIAEKLFDIDFPDVPAWAGGSVFAAAPPPEFTGALAASAIFRFLPPDELYARAAAPDLTAARSQALAPLRSVTTAPTIVNNTTVTVTGALDPDAVADQIHQLLENRRYRLTSW